MSAKLPMFAMLLVLAASGPAFAQSGSDATELEPMVVKPLINPLDESMERLRTMMEDAPCLGCGPLQEAARISVYEKTYYGVGAVLSFFSGMPEKPFELSFEERQEARVANDWRMYERGPER